LTQYLNDTTVEKNSRMTAVCTFYRSHFSKYFETGLNY